MQADQANASRSIDRIEIMPISMLAPYPRNARTHSRKQIRQIAESMRRFGFTNPVLVDDANQIIAGHGRVEAAKQVGLTEVPTVRLSHLSTAEKRAYVLADNKLALQAGWDREILAIELQALIDLDFEVELTGFETPEVDLLLGEAAEAAAETGPEDDVPATPAAGTEVSRLGDLWALGPHRLLCGDALDASSYQILMAGELAQLICCDAPYNVPINGHVSGLGRVRHNEFKMASGEMTPDDFTGFLTTVFRHLVANSTNGSIHFHFMDWRHMTEMLTAGHTAYAELKNLIVWNKTNGGMGSFYRSKHELIFAWKNGTAPHVNNFELGQHGRSRCNVWDYAGVNTFRPGRLEELAMHPTTKPTAMLADAIKDCSHRNELVLDPFMGSGTTVIAAERTGRRGRGIELDARYLDVAVRRWQSYTGKLAKLVATQQTFEEVEEERRSTAATLPESPNACAPSIEEGTK